MPVVLITGSGTGIGALTASALAATGWTVWASMRDPEGRNAARAAALRSAADAAGHDLRVVDLDVTSDRSIEAAVARVLAESGAIDVVVHNAAHLLVGYTEAFTAEDLAHLFDTNAISVQRVNRAVLPHMRAARSGVLVYIGSTTTVVVPPFLGPYVASKFAFDALAQVTAYEVSQFGIETVIVMPGAFTKGTEHFPNAGSASDHAVTATYARLDHLVERNEAATAALFDPDVDADPVAVAAEVVRVLGLPVGAKPRRTVVDFTQADVDRVNEVMQAEQDEFVRRLGFGELLEVARPD